MKFLKWLFVLLILLAVGVWFGVPALLQTTWAKDQVKEALERHTQRDVAVGSLRFSWMDGLKVADVTVKQKPGPFASEGPLFTLGSLDLDVGFRELLDKKLDVKSVVVKAPNIVLVRDAQGVFNIADLLSAPSAPTTPPAGPPSGTKPAPTSGSTPPPSSAPPAGPDLAPTSILATIKIEDGKLLYVDQKVSTRATLEDVDAEAHWSNGKLNLTGTFKLNGGAGRFTGEADLSKTPAPFEIKEFVLDETNLDANLASLGLFLPLMGDKPQQASGTVKFDLKDVKGEGLDLASIQRTLRASGNLELKGGTMVSGPIAQIYGALEAIGAQDPSKLFAGATDRGLALNLVKSGFTIANGRVTSPAISVTGSGIDLSLAGSTGLDGSLDFTINAKGLNQLLSGIKELRPILGDSNPLPLKLGGNLTDPKVTVDLAGSLLNTLKSEATKRLGGELDKLTGDATKKLGGELDKLTGDATKKLGGEAEKALGGALKGLLGGKKEDPKKKE